MNPGTAVPLAAVAAAFAWWLRRPGWVLVGSRVSTSSGSPRWIVPSLAVAGVVGLVGSGALLTAPHVVLTVGAVGVLVFTLRRVRAARRRALVLDGERRVVEIVETLATEARSGISPLVSLERSAAEFDELAPVLAAAREHRDLEVAWRRAAAAPGHEGLHHVAAAWAVSARSGSPLAATLTRVVADLRHRQDIRNDVAGAVAPARSTAVLMAVLPVFALALGSGLGGSPVDTITSTLPGAVSVVIGACGAVIGIAWVDRIVASVEDQA